MTAPRCSAEGVNHSTNFRSNQGSGKLVKWFEWNVRRCKRVLSLFANSDPLGRVPPIGAASELLGLTF